MLTLKQSKTKRTCAKENRLVTDVMRNASTIHDYDPMSMAIDKIFLADATSAVAVDGLGKCVGVLTQTDIRRYYAIWTRYLDGDFSVLKKVFERDGHSLLRIDRDAFHRVRKHMTAPVVTISDTATFKMAQELLANNQNIHHLIVTDDKGCPVGIVASDQLTNTF